MREEKSVFRTLVEYFFTRFFENDVLRSEGDTLTTVVRALSIVAVPGLMAAFFLQNAYNAVPGRSAWGKIEDHYVFVLYSLLALAGVAVFEWGMLFPDKLDFLVLSPLPIKSKQMLGAKALALGGFLGFFLVAANVFGACVLPMVGREAMLRQMLAHVLAVGGAGLFGALTMLGAGGVMLCVLPARMFRVISPLLQMLAVMLLGAMCLHYVRFGDELEMLLQSPAGVTRWMPSFWFLGMYEVVQRGAGAAPFTDAMMRRGVWALVIACVVVVVSYPLAWGRMRRMAIESAGAARGGKASVFAAITNWIARVPASRAIAHFIGQTLRRDSRYHVYLAMYCGVGLTLAMACALRLQASAAVLWVEVSQKGLREVMPLLLFWAIAGLRMAFAVPLGLNARWVFRVTGAERAWCVAASRGWVLCCGLALTVVLLVVLAPAMSVRALLVQAVCGAGLCVLMVEGLLFADNGIPFTQPRQPGRTSLPLMLTLFVGVLPAFVMGMAWVAAWMERRLARLLLVIIVAAMSRWVAQWLRRNSQADLEDGDEVEAEFQLLGLGVE